jgi:hypothetical protein
MKPNISKFIKSSPFQYLMVALIIVAILVYVGYNSGKKKFGSSSVNTPYPDGGQTLPTGGQKILDDLVNQSYNVLSGFDFSQSKELTFQRYKVLTNDQMTYVYKRYNDLYEQKDGMTLTARMDDEWFPTPAITDAINRLRNLNLF